MSSFSYKKLVFRLILLWLTVCGFSVAQLRAVSLQEPDRHGIPAPYCFAGYCRLEMDEWIVGGGGQVIHFSTYAPKREQRLTEEDLYGVSFVNSSTGWVVGTKGTIFHTIDNGKHWKPQVSGVEKTLRGISCVNENQCWVVGDYGIILSTDDGGQTWNQLPTGVSAKDFYAVDFINEKTGWAVGEDGIVLRTHDGGQTWEQYRARILLFPNTNFEEPSDMLAVKFANENLGWIAGRGGLARTTDGGVTWETKIEDESFVGVSSQDGNKVWAVNAEGPNYCSEDGGISWTKCVARKTKK